MTAESKQTALAWIEAHHDLIVDAHQRIWELGRGGAPGDADPEAAGRYPGRAWVHR